MSRGSRIGIRAKRKFEVGLLRNLTSNSRREVSTRGYALAIVCQPVSTEKHRVRQPKMGASTKGR